MIPAPDTAAIRAQIRREIAGKLPAFAVDEVTDIALHAVDTAMASMNAVLMSASDARITITAAGIAGSILADHFPQVVRAMANVAERNGMQVHTAQVQA